jgi:hypothetical protein
MPELFQVTNLSASHAAAVMEMLERDGFEYDTDFTTVYGAGWRIVGIRAMTPQGARALALMMAR